MMHFSYHTVGVRAKGACMFAYTTVHENFQLYAYYQNFMRKKQPVLCTMERLKMTSESRL
jgi:hypothetical protein